ncbi:MAG: type VII toxin-antitoxin system HepT family RNase toxin [Chloroflexota bacterium]
MNPQPLSRYVITDRIQWIEKMLAEIQQLPLESQTVFLADSRNIWSAESCLRRALEALFDLGRHILAKGFAEGTSEYKGITLSLERHKVITSEEASVMMILAGYRNRLVHFYHEVSAEELFQICVHQLNDVVFVLNGIRRWINNNQNLLDDSH